MTSMVRSVLLIHHKIDVSTIRIKRVINANQIKIKKAATFTEEQINKYLTEEKSTGQALVNKLMLMFGLYGSLRVSELTMLCFEDVEFVNRANIRYLKVNITKSKTDQTEKGFFFDT